nr:FecR domain-containing protein [Roseateles oligotrophus]
MPEPVIAAAIGWAVKQDLGRPDAPAQAGFAEWLAADPLHALAWQRVSALHAGHAPPGSAKVLGLALNQARRKSGRRQALKLLSLAGLGTGTAWLAREQLPWQRLLADASTAIGEQKTLRLADGSRLMLNTDSAVRSAITPQERRVELLRGEIGISTLAADGRPFWIDSPAGRVQAGGCRLVLRLMDDRARLRISVQQGAAALHPAADASRSEVQAGQSRWLSATGSSVADASGLPEADAWTDGVVAGQRMRLDQVLAELARYRHGRIRCDARVAGLPVSGVFHVARSEQALEFLQRSLPIRVRRLTPWWTEILPR